MDNQFVILFTNKPVSNTKIIFVMRKALLLIIVIIACSLATQAQTIVVLPASHDAALGYHDNFNTAGNNYGTATQNAGYTIPGANGGLNVNRALIQFDLSLLPQGAFIQSAKLNLYAHGQSGPLIGHSGTNNAALLRRVTGPWSENTVTWNSQPSDTSLNEVLLSASTGPLQDYLNIDVTALVKDMQNNNNWGFLLKQVNESPSNVLLFASKDFANSAKHPQLVINYELETSLENLNETDLFQIYPNPNSGNCKLSISSFSALEEMTVEIYTISGDLVRTVIVDAEISHLNMTDLDAGAYLFRAKVGDRTQTKKIILQGKE
ncbi:MAG TPA: DNRLRE domain-containing protein [Bacteroidetes bacterium]|nr:DNRLRE domain-containing protein [Bacteroidota bacterium]